MLGAIVGCVDTRRITLANKWLKGTGPVTE